jgi:hypothetical protein
MAYNGANEVVIVSHSNVVYWWPAWVMPIPLVPAQSCAIDGRPGGRP